MQPADIAIVVVLALIVFGPKKLPEVGKQLSQAMRELRKITREATGAASPADKPLLLVFLMALIVIILLNAARQG